MSEKEIAPAKKKRRTSYSASSRRTAEKKHGMSAPDKMQLLFAVVNREKTEFFIDMLQAYEINMQMVLAASGTASTQIMELLGITASEKSVIISVIRRDRAKAALDALDNKFKTLKGGKGIAYTVPMSSIIGVAIYQFLGNKTAKIG